jgi:hypothetical protein
MFTVTVTTMLILLLLASSGLLVDAGGYWGSGGSLSGTMFTGSKNEGGGTIQVRIDPAKTKPSSRVAGTNNYYGITGQGQSVKVFSKADGTFQVTWSGK